MSKCMYDLSEDCHNKDCLTCVLDKIRDEIDKQAKWLLQAGYTTYNVDIAIDAIKSVIDKYKAESEG